MATPLKGIFTTAELEEIERLKNRLVLYCLMCRTVVDHLPEFIDKRFQRGFDRDD